MLSPSLAKAGSSSSSLVNTQTRPVSTSNTCDPSVSVWKQPSTGRRVYLLGTAHISSESAALAGRVVQDVHPEAVFVELDAKRVRQTDASEAATVSTEEPQPSEAYPKKGIKVPPSVVSGPELSPPASTLNEGNNNKKKKKDDKGAGVAGAAIGSAIKGMYKKLDDKGFQPGQEFAVAAKEGYKIGARIVLGDRDVEVTLRRLAQALRKTDLKTLLVEDSELERTMSQLMPGKKIPSQEDDNFKEELSFYVENMKAKENVQLLMSQLKRIAPEIYTAMVQERDEYMGNGLDQLSIFPNVVAVMGMAHVDGVETYLRGHGWEPVPLRCRN